MARIPGASARQAGLLARIIQGVARRKVGKLTGRAEVPLPIRIMAHHTRLLVALGQMEMGQEAARSVEPALKTLAAVLVARFVGCPF